MNSKMSITFDPLDFYISKQENAHLEYDKGSWKIARNMTKIDKKDNFLIKFWPSVYDII